MLRDELRYSDSPFRDGALVSERLVRSLYINNYGIVYSPLISIAHLSKITNDKDNYANNFLP